MGTKGVSSDCVKKKALFSSLSEWTVMCSEDKVLILTSFQVLVYVLPYPTILLVSQYGAFFKASQIHMIFIALHGHFYQRCIQKWMSDFHFLEIFSCWQTTFYGKLHQFSWHRWIFSFIEMHDMPQKSLNFSFIWTRSANDIRKNMETIFYITEQAKNGINIPLYKLGEMNCRKCGHSPANHLKLTRCAKWYGDSSGWKTV